MNRLVLTLLALLTGLVAQAAPAQAGLRTPTDAEIGAVESSVAASAAASDAVIGGRPAAEPVWPARVEVGDPQFAPPQATVLIRIDRARE